MTLPPSRLKSRARELLHEILKQSHNDGSIEVLRAERHGDAILGFFAGAGRIYQYKITPGNIAYKIHMDLYAPAPANEPTPERLDSLLSALRLDSKPKRCSKGFGCGRSCVKRGYTCHVQDVKLRQATHALLRLWGRGGQSSSSTGIFAGEGNWADDLIAQEVKKGNIPDLPAPPQKFDSTPAAQAAARSAEKATRMHDQEVAVLISSSGKILKQSEGGERQINFTLPQSAVSAVRRGGILTHNHPPYPGEPLTRSLRASFSLADIDAAIMLKASEIRASGGDYVYRLTPTMNGKPMTREDLYQKVYPTLRRAIREEHDTNFAVWRSKTGSTAGAAYLCYHRAWQRTAHEHGIPYVREYVGARS